MVVDAHAHVFAAVSERFPRDVHELTPPGLEAPVEQLVAQMERAGVDRAVLVPLSQHDEYLKFSLEQFPGRFAAIGVQPPGPVDVEAYVARRESVGLQGVRLFSLGSPSAVAAEGVESLPLLAELARAGDKLWFYGARPQMELLELVLERLPELTVVLNHLGFWPTELSMDEHGRPHFATSYTREGLDLVVRLSRFPRVFVLCTGLYAFARDACPYESLRPVTAALLEAYGPERLLLGSDSPWVLSEPGYAETLAVVDAQFAGLGEADRALIRGGNAARLFSFGAGGQP